jgi:uncharacterized protein (DUF169 family)
MPSSSEIADALARYVRPGGFPVGVLVLRREEDAPPDLLKRARVPGRDLGHAVTICMGVGLARRYGWTLLLRREDNVCPLGGVALGFEPARERYRDGSLFAEYTGRPREAVARMAQETPRLPACAALLLAPLSAGAFEPDLTIVYGDSAQVMRLVQGAVHATGGYVPARASGVLDCADLIPGTLQAGQCQVILPCNGDRVFGMAQDHEMAFTLPRDRAAEVLQGLADSHRMGQRYPTPTFMRFAPEMPPAYQRLLEYLREGAPARD